jgi:RNA polymerase sigma factor (sigma-70 family)
LEPSDSEILRRTAEGDELAALALHRRFFPDLAKYAQYKLGLDVHDAQELANEAILRLIRSENGATLSRDFKLTGWLITTVRNLAIDVHRKKSAREGEVRLLYLDGTDAEGEMGEGRQALERELVSSFYSTGEKKDQRASIIVEAFKAFTVEEQDIFMAYVSGMTHHEIAQIRVSNPVATRKYVNRLKDRFFDEVERLTGISSKETNERWQRGHSAGSFGGSAQRSAGGSSGVLGKPD